ncbi:hypothetical protein N7468_003230 [Penicillium chermesinum]|uniref:Uncharacterized protein n=1 Tax=Penicillium chermesinum TaxID=63820 RepID=A0A9W9TRE4_9EURO|nr:uncharacterized protein N7468_003230 [Penicillium chermesinum]KAJ5238611.1 hypothetical protein N7468_003230 [Penicillium chermesinum]
MLSYTRTRSFGYRYPCPSKLFMQRLSNGNSYLDDQMKNNFGTDDLNLRMLRGAPTQTSLLDKLPLV